jgi:hypothetical protein
VQIEEFKRETLGKLQDLRCPDHHQPPRLVFHGRTIQDVSLQIKSCCHKMAAMANQKIAGKPV